MSSKPSTKLLEQPAPGDVPSMARAQADELQRRSYRRRLNPVYPNPGKTCRVAIVDHWFISRAGGQRQSIL
jgi:hypothetical protein